MGTPFSANLLLDRLSKSKKTLTICHKVYESAAPSVIFDGYPKDVGTAFSGTIQQAFPSIKNMTLVAMQAYREPQVITITGGTMDSVKKTLKWALGNYDGKGLKRYTPANESPFVEAREDKTAGQVLDMPSFTARVDAYMQDRLSKGVLSGKEVTGLHAKNAYPEYRLGTGVPAQEPCLPLKVVAKDDPTFNTLVQHVADRTTNDMQAKYNAEKQPQTMTLSTKARPPIDKFDILPMPIASFATRFQIRLAKQSM